MPPIKDIILVADLACQSCGNTEASHLDTAEGQLFCNEQCASSDSKRSVQDQIFNTKAQLLLDPISNEHVIAVSGPKSWFTRQKNKFRRNRATKATTERMKKETELENAKEKEAARKLKKPNSTGSEFSLQTLLQENNISLKYVTSETLRRETDLHEFDTHDQRFISLAIGALESFGL